MSWLNLVLLTITFGTAISIESRVFGAEDLRFNVHKYLVKLKVFHNGYTNMCSGSILDKQWVITSAHCFSGDEKSVAVYHQTEEGTRIIAKADRSNIILHPNWIPGINTNHNRRFDIALLRTTRIDFSDYVQPIKLSKTFSRDGESAIIAGFGETEGELEPPREGFVHVNWCRFGVPWLLCSEDYVRAGSGDSGGALVSRGKLIGVTSASCKNAEQPNVCVTVYVSVAAHFKWLKEVLL